ncbi:hypothetical protein AVEN_36522-1, partial [Araneus ventricosus]
LRSRGRDPTTRPPRPRKHCIGQSCENPTPVILDNESEEGDAPAPIDMVDEQLECEDIEL